MLDSTFTLRIRADIYEHKPSGVTVHYMDKEIGFNGNGKKEDILMAEQCWLKFEKDLLESKIAMDLKKGGGAE